MCILYAAEASPCLSVCRCLIVVSVHGSDEYSTLTSRSIPAQCVESLCSEYGADVKSINIAVSPSSMACNLMVCCLLRCLRRGRPQDGTLVFEKLEYPSFVEFDDVNSKVLSYNAATRCASVQRNMPHIDAGAAWMQHMCIRVSCS
jgi:hypothetical protein